VTQNEYLEILFQDCGIDTRARRNDFYTVRVGREIKYLDDLQSHEKSLLINELKDRKAGNYTREDE
jgi:hypothetical protein